MSAYPPQKASSDGHYIYRDFGRQHQQYQELQHQPPLRQQQIKQEQVPIFPSEFEQQHQQSGVSHYLNTPRSTQQHRSHSHVFPHEHHSILSSGPHEVKTEQFHQSQQLALIPHIAVQAPRERTDYNSQAIRKYPLRQQQQRQQRQQPRYRRHRHHQEYRQRPQKQQHNHKHHHHCLCLLPNASPGQTGRANRRAPRISGDKEASLRYWLSEYIDAGEVQGNEIVNLDEAEHNSDMDEPLPPTPASPKSMALSSDQSPNGPVSDFYHDKDRMQTPQSAKVKSDVDHCGPALWSVPPFDANAQEHTPSLGQTQPAYYEQTGAGQGMCSYSSSHLQPISASHMLSMPAIQEGQAFQFDPLGTGYHHPKMEFVSDAFFHEPPHTAAALSGFPVTDKPHGSIPMSTSLSSSSASPGSGERQNAQAAWARMARGCHGAPMARSRSNIEATAKPCFVRAAAAPNEAEYHSMHNMHMSQAASVRAFTAPGTGNQGQPLLHGSADAGNGTLADASMHQTAPMQHSLSSRSTSSGSSFISHSALHPLYAPSVIPAAFYSTDRQPSGTGYPFLGQMQSPSPPGHDSREHPNHQGAGVKRPASSLGDQMTPQPSAKRRMKGAQIKAEEVETPCINSGNSESLFNFDDYIDMTQAHKTTETTTCGSLAAPIDVSYDGLADQALASELMRSIEGLSSDAARNTALVTAATPPPPAIEHNGTVSPEDLFIHPFSATRPTVKQQPDKGPSSCMALVPKEQTSFLPEFDPALIGGYRGRSSADDSNATEDIDVGARGMDEVYPYGSVIGSPRLPHPSPISDLSTYSGHVQHGHGHGNCSHHHSYSTTVHQPTMGPEMHNCGNQSSYPPPDSQVPHGPPSPHTLCGFPDLRNPRNTQASCSVPDASSVLRSPMGPINTEAETELIRMRAAEEQRHAEAERRRKDRILLQLKREGYTYREIREKGDFTEAESTLRGRYRTLTKAKQERVRKPTWTENDDRLLVEAVNFMARGRHMGQFKVAWKAVSEWIVDNGGSYRFGNTTCRKRYDYLVEEGMVRCSSQTTDDDGDDDNDDDDDDEDDDEPSVVYFNQARYAEME